MATASEKSVPGTWRDAMQMAWGGVPASDLLSVDATAWADVGLAPPSGAEIATWALYGRLLKYGMSLSAALPLLDPQGVVRLLVYLHRLRMDALTGTIQSPWLNPSNAAIETDVVFFSRPQARYHELVRIQGLCPRVIGRSSGLPAKEGQVCTWLGDVSEDVMTLAEQVEGSNYKSGRKRQLRHLNYLIFKPI